jgi:hypothetical protein
VAGRDDVFRNELYSIICGRHPDFGYIDQPLIAAATQIFGNNVWLLRLPAVIAAVAIVPLTAARFCGAAKVGGTFGAPFAIPSGNDRPIILCKGLKRNLSETWERFKRHE